MHFLRWGGGGGGANIDNMKKYEEKNIFLFENEISSKF